MADPMLFPFLDTAVRVIAVLVLCAIPVLIPLPSSPRPSPSREKPKATRHPITTD